MKNVMQTPASAGNKKKKESAPVNSGVDRKNNAISKGYTPPTERVKRNPVMALPMKAQLLHTKAIAE